MTQMVQPAPSPETWGSGIQPMANGEVHVKMLIAHVGGTHVSYLTPDAAESIATNMLAAVREARTGLATPPPNGKLIIPGEIT